MKYFVDTSALVKTYHQERGSEKAVEIYRSNHKIVISDLTRIEFVSTIHRKYRENAIGLEALDVLIAKFQDDVDLRYEVLGFSSMVLDEAWRLIVDMGRQHPLRTLDSLQLAFYSTYCDEGDIFVCSDKKLNEAVQIRGYDLLAP